MRTGVTAILLAAVAQVGCGPAPSPTPGGALAVHEELSRRGVRILQAVSGRSACPAQRLEDNALYLSVEFGPEPAAYEVYVYLFRPRDFEAAAPQIDACVATYGWPPAPLVDRVDVPPYVALGADWPDELERAVEEALRAAAGER